MELLAALHKVEERGALETADRALMLARQVWEYWLPTAGVEQSNITEGLKARLTPYKNKSFAAIIEPKRFGDLTMLPQPVIEAMCKQTKINHQRAQEILSKQAKA
jgi:hypothetical protein